MRALLAPAVLRFALEPLPLLRDLARLDGIGDHREGVAGSRHALEPQDLYRNRRTGLLHRLAPLVVQRAHAAGEFPADEVVADPEGALLLQDRGQRALARVEGGLEHRAVALAIGIGLEIKDLGLKQDLLEQQVDTGALLGRDLGGQRLAAEFLEHHVVLQEVLLDLLHVGGGQVDLVDGHDHRHAGVLGVADGLDRLRHDLVIGRDDEHHDVGDLGTAGPHGGERLVARRVEEGDLPVARQRRRGTRRCAG